MIIDARPPFEVIKVLDTGPITDHANFARNSRGQFAYVTVGGLNLVKRLSYLYAFETDWLLGRRDSNLSHSGIEIRQNSQPGAADRNSASRNQIC